MSLITGFNYDVYCGDLRMRQNVIEKLGISLSLMSAEDTERCSFVEVKVRTGMEMRGTPWKPIVKKGKEYPTLWDTRMGNFECKGFPTQPCTTCAATTSGGQQTATSMRYGNQRCPGHFGFISMPRTDPENEQASAERLFVYNPHMQSELETLLCAECFFCHRFRCDSYDVERYRAALILCDTGLVGEALHFLEIVPNARSQERTSKRRRDPDEKTVTDIGSLHRLLFSTLRRNDKDPEKVMKACAALTNKSSSGGVLCHSSPEHHII